MLAFPGKEILRRGIVDAARRRAKCLFVLSTGRCGTTTLTSLLSLSPGIHAVHMPHPQYREETRHAYQAFPLSRGEARRYLQAYAWSRIGPLRRSLVSGKYYAECSCRLTFFGPELASFFPRARFLHLYRNPADVVRSGMRRGYYVNHGWDPYRITPRSDDPHAESWSEWGPFEKCCWFWKEINRFSLETVSSLDPARTRSVRFESLVSPDGQAARELFEWLGVATPPQDEIRRVISVPENAQREGEFPRWPDWTEAQKETLAAIAGLVAVRLGYDQYALSAQPL